jgi:hypothetical protein
VERVENAMADTRYQLAGNAPQLYERETVHTPGRPLAALLCAHVSLHAGDRVLDAVYGTGIVTRMAIQRYDDLGHVVGVEEVVRQAIGQEVSAALHAYRDGAEVVIPHRRHLVQAQAA